MEPDIYYGFHFMGQALDQRKLIQSFLPVGQLSLDEIADNVKDYLREIDFNASCCLIKELTLFNGNVAVNKPSKVGGEKLQAFMLKKPSDTINHDNKGVYLINGEEFSLNFTQYDVTILDV